MTTQDPTADEMREHLRAKFGQEADEFDVESAIYWFAANYHGGQDSNLYSALSTSEFEPGPIARGPQAGSMESICYEALYRRNSPAAK